MIDDIGAAIDQWFAANDEIVHKARTDADMHALTAQLRKHLNDAGVTDEAIEQECGNLGATVKDRCETGLM